MGIRMRFCNPGAKAGCDAGLPSAFPKAACICVNIYSLLCFPLLGGMKEVWIRSRSRASAFGSGPGTGSVRVVHVRHSNKI